MPRGARQSGQLYPRRPRQLLCSTGPAQLSLGRVTTQCVTESVATGPGRSLGPDARGVIRRPCPFPELWLYTIDDSYEQRAWVRGALT